MAGRGRGGGRFGRGGGWAARVGGRGVGVGAGRAMVCACEANAPLLAELRNFDDECLRTGKVKLRHGLKRAMRSLERYPLPVTTEKEACALEGVGSFTARRMLRGLSSSSAASAGVSSSDNRSTANDEENIEPTRGSSSSSSTIARSRKPSGNCRSDGNSTCGSSAVAASGCRSSSSNSSSVLRMNLRPDGAHRHGRGRDAARPSGKPLSLAHNFAALRGDDDVDDSGAQTPDVTPRRPTSRARIEEVGGAIDGFSSKAPRFFSGEWEAWLIVDNRENDFMSMQSTLLQKGVRCETRQLPLGDMLWIARRRDDPTSEVLLGYIVERKTASDLASSIIDGRYDEQKRRLKLSGLRRRIYLVEGNLSRQSQLAPSALRTALASSQAKSGLAVVQCDSLRDSVDFLARTHRHIASLLLHACRSSSSPAAEGQGYGGLWSSISSSDGALSGTGGGGGLLRPAMTYGEYAQGCAKRAGAVTVRKLLGAMMRQVPGCSAARAEAVVRAFQSPLGLMLALERAADGDGATGRDRGDVDGDVTRMKRVDALLAGLVCRGGAGTNKLPQPLRRLLCRLFVGESVDSAAEVDIETGAQGGVACGGIPTGFSGLSSGDIDPDPYSGGWDVEPMSQDGDPYLST
eukprot:g11106.t1